MRSKISPTIPVVGLISGICETSQIDRSKHIFPNEGCISSIDLYRYFLDHSFVSWSFLFFFFSSSSFLLRELSDFPGNLSVIGSFKLIPDWTVGAMDMGTSIFGTIWSCEFGDGLNSRWNVSLETVFNVRVMKKTKKKGKGKEHISSSIPDWGKLVVYSDLTCR